MSANILLYTSNLKSHEWYGLVSVSKQAKLTAIAVNLKKISKLFSSDFTSVIQFFAKNNLKNYIIIYFKNFAII